MPSLLCLALPEPSMNGVTNLLLLAPRRKLSLDNASSSHPAWDQPDAHRVAAGHQPVAVVLDLVNPVRAGRGLVGGGRETGLDEFGVGGKPFTHTLDQHVANLVSQSQEVESD
jgi:hypothetical protein